MSAILDREDVEVLDQWVEPCNKRRVEGRRVKVTIPSDFSTPAIPASAFGFKEIIDVCPACDDTETKIYPVLLVSSNPDEVYIVEYDASDPGYVTITSSTPPLWFTITGIL